MMDKINIILMILCAILLVLAESCMHGHAYRYKNPPKPCKGNIFIKRIPENDRNDFLSYELITAIRKYNRSDIVLKYGQYDLQRINIFHQTKFKHIIIPMDFSKNLLRWVEVDVKKTRLMSFKSAIFMCRGLCFPGGCVDVADIGSLCCPF